MRSSSQEQANEQAQGIRDIPTWARRYAQNRTLAVVVTLILFLGGFLAIHGVSYLLGRAYRAGDQPLSAVLLVLLGAVLILVVWFISRGGAATMRRITEGALYRSEGTARIGPSPAGAARPASSQACLEGLLFVFCVIAAVRMGLIGFLPGRDVHAASPLYVVPFIFYLWARLRWVWSPFMLLWPVLYGLHAILLVAGVPIHFGGRYEGLNMLVPMVGYGLVAAVAGHIYSRIALRRLRRLAASPDVPANTEGGVQ